MVSAYTYNARNQQTGYSGAVITSYTYSPNGLRKSKHTATTFEKFFVWSDGNMVYEYEANAPTSGTIYVYGINLISSRNSGGFEKFYLYNAHGDVVQIINGSGNITHTYDYDAFGNEKNPSSTDTNYFRYCGQYLDVETGTYYLRARYYDPATGRFTSEDPIGDGLNWYTYCANSPITYIDPSGLVLQLTGTLEEKWKALNELQQLTNYPLGFDKNGYVSADVESWIGEEEYEYGNELILEIIENTYTCTIKTTNSTKKPYYTHINNIEDAKNANKGSGSVIYYNPSYLCMISVIIDNEPSYEPSEVYINLAHELIHSFHAMKGTVKYTKVLCKVLKSEPKNFLFWKIRFSYHFIYKDELIATGTPDAFGNIYNKEGDITENMIRAEHSLLLRWRY